MLKQTFFVTILGATFSCLIVEKMVYSSSMRVGSSSTTDLLGLKGKKDGSGPNGSEYFLIGIDVTIGSYVL
jgi:hypothetical protein